MPRKSEPGRLAEQSPALIEDSHQHCSDAVLKLKKPADQPAIGLELPIGLRLIDCPVLISHGKAWARLRSKPVIDRDGRHVQANGKGQWAPIVKWANKTLDDLFFERIVELVRETYPGNLVDDGAP